MSRILNLLLATLAIAGLIASLRARSEQRPILQEYEQLIAAVGTMDIQDPNQFHALSLPADAPYRFSWRIYQPANFDIQTRTSGIAGNSSSSYTNRTANESLCHVSFRFTDDCTSVYCKTSSGSTTSTFGDAKTARFLREHWQHLVVQRSGSLAPATADETQLLPLLSIRIPQSLHPEIRQQLGPKSGLLKGPLYEVHLGTPTAFRQAESNGR